MAVVKYRHITLAEALAESPDDELFGPSYDARQAALRAQARTREALVKLDMRAAVEALVLAQDAAKVPQNGA